MSTIPQRIAIRRIGTVKPQEAAKATAKISTPSSMIAAQNGYSLPRTRNPQQWSRLVCLSGGLRPGLSKLRFVGFVATSGSAACYVERLCLSVQQWAKPPSNTMTARLIWTALVINRRYSKLNREQILLKLRFRLLLGNAEAPCRGRSHQQLEAPAPPSGQDACDRGQVPERRRQ